MSDQPKKQELPPIERMERTVKCCVCGWYTAGVPQAELLAALSDNEAKDARYEADIQVEIDKRDEFCKSAEAAEAKLKSVEGLLEENSEPVSLLDCPPGMFLYNQNLGLKTEYTDPFGRIDVYVAESGEAFWGGVSDADKRDELMVHPVPADLLARIREAIK